MKKTTMKRSVMLGTLITLALTSSVWAASVDVANGVTKSDEAVISVGSGESFKNAGTVIASDSITTSGGLFQNTGVIETGVLEINGNTNDTGVIGGSITATEKITYKGLINGNLLGRSVTAELDTPLLEIIGSNVQTGLKVADSAVLANVDEVKVHTNGTRTALVIAAGSDVEYDGTIRLTGTGETRLEVENGASVEVGTLINEATTGKIQLNQANTSATVDNITVKENSNFSIQTWSNNAADEVTVTLNDITVEDGAVFKTCVYGDTNSAVNITGDALNINLGSNATVDMGGMSSADWRAERISVTADSMTVNVSDPTTSKVYISASEGTTLTGDNISVIGAGAANTGDAAADLANLANVVQFTQETAGEEASALPTTAAAEGASLTQEGTSIFDAATGTVAVDETGSAVVKNVSVTKNANAFGVAENNALSLIAWRSEMNDMNKRLGELRNAQGENGIWMRMVRGEAEYESITNQYNQYQLGYDRKIGSDWTVGAAFTYTDGESSYSTGSAENKHTGFALYGSKLNADGSFIDVIAKYARLENDFVTSIGSGDYDSNGFSLSAEYGKRIQCGNGLWIEPQAELSYGNVGSADYKLGNIDVAQDSIDSLVGRVGFSLGKDIKRGNVYARASYLYDFDGETSASFADGDKTRTIEQDLGGGWVEIGIGTNYNLSDATYLYADIEKTFGGEVDINWQWNLGVRYSF